MTSGRIGQRGALAGQAEIQLQDRHPRRMMFGVIGELTAAPQALGVRIAAGYFTLFEISRRPWVRGFKSFTGTIR